MPACMRRKFPVSPCLSASHCPSFISMSSHWACRRQRSVLSNEGIRILLASQGLELQLWVDSLFMSHCCSAVGWRNSITQPLNVREESSVARCILSVETPWASAITWAVLELTAFGGQVPCAACGPPAYDHKPPCTTAAYLAATHRGMCSWHHALQLGS